jgi:Trk K+ transport system NAD-binding subunit
MITSHDVWVSDLERVSAIVLRAMRRPLLTLIAVFAITIIGMVLVPGPIVEGKTTRMGFFHALYFLSYTATTTGFGEIPYEFSDAQRLWAIISLMISVIAWVYAIGSIIALLRNEGFRRGVEQRRFSKQVSRISEPFFIICGFGDTGSLLTRGVITAGFGAVVIDNAPNRIQALKLRDYPVPVPGLCADMGIPRHLIAAGLLQPNCRAVVAVSNDEGINRKSVVMAHLINPRVRSICRSTSRVEGEFLEALGVNVVDPFKIFAGQLGIALNRPVLHTLIGWLAGSHGVKLDRPVRPPKGTWIVCGFGRMGKSLREALEEQRIRTLVIDPDPEEILEPRDRIIGYTNARTLREAGIEQAVGIVAATNSDSNNLGILLNARMLNPNLFVVVRQNRHDDEPAFQASGAHLVMQPCLVTARHILLILISPLTRKFQDYLQNIDVETLTATTRRLQDAVGEEAARLWIETIPTCAERVRSELVPEDYSPTLGDIMRDPVDRARNLSCVPLAHERGGRTRILPVASQELKAGDQILFCGTSSARRVMNTTLTNTYLVSYQITGIDEPRGHLMRWFNKRFRSRVTVTG